MHSETAYRLVKVAGGAHSVHSVAHRETFHPVIGPVAEAEALYVRQLHIPDRMARCQREFAIWDVGLGAAANVLTVLRNVQHLSCPLHLISFDHTLEPLRFALQHAEALGYFTGYEQPVQSLADHGRVEFKNGNMPVRWQLFEADFPTLIESWKGTLAGQGIPAPDAILFDAYSPAKNPAMWTQPLFASIYRLLDPQRPCSLPTYSRSTMLRVSLLLAGFYVGVGHATGEKDETTIAANSMELIAEPLPQTWLKRVHNSTSAEPLWEPHYRQAPLSPSTWEKLLVHPQFSERK